MTESITERDIVDVRKALWSAYETATKDPEYCGKSNEGYCELYYPNFWECEDETTFLKPKGLMIYSYALGPSRTHYFDFSEKNSHPNYYTWNCIDPYSTAIKVINGWLDEFLESEPHD